ncbi:hypothetical protein SLA2020_236250 [Shorea laevis]
MSKLLLLLLSFLFYPLTLCAPVTYPPPTYLSPGDAIWLLSFKAKADLDNKILYVLNERFDYCQWQGVKCAQGRVVRFVLPNFGLRGTFPANSLSRLDQLRVLSLHNNSLSGPIPDLSSLYNLKSLFLDHNSFSGSFPLSVLLLHRVSSLDLSFNNLNGEIPAGLTVLARLNSLRLEQNRFNGTVPPLNQTFLVTFNVSGNNLTGPIPVTRTLSRFNTTAFSVNPSLCGKIINKACTSRGPFFEPSNGSSSASSPLGQSVQSQGGRIVVLHPPSPKKNQKTGVIIGFGVGVVVIASFSLALAFVRKQTSKSDSKEAKPPSSLAASDPYQADPRIEYQVEENRGFQAKRSKIEVPEVQKVRKSGNLVFSAGAAEVYTLEQLMKASAELLGRGTIGTTYKAVLDNQLIVTVKRVDASKTAIVGSEEFEQHMDTVGALRHPNLVPLRAYFQSKGERLVMYDYQPNGSLFNLIHGSRSTRAKPLHWTSCLKIAEDVAQGLNYIHQASKLVHGNLKSSNVLLGADFEACLTDYCLAVFSDPVEDPDSAAYRAPETRKSSRRATPKSDVYSFGVLLLELLTGKHPSEHQVLMPHDLLDWVRTVREDGSGEYNRLGMFTEVASVCRLTSPEQRPAMWQVLKMIQKIKERALMENNAMGGYSQIQGKKK